MQSLNDVRSAETSLKPDNAPWRTVAAGTREIGIADDRIASQADEEWNRRVLELMSSSNAPLELSRSEMRSRTWRSSDRKFCSTSRKSVRRSRAVCMNCWKRSLSAVSSSNGRSPIRARSVSASSASRRRLSSAARASGSVSVPSHICRGSSNRVRSRDSVPTKLRSVVEGVVVEFHGGRVDGSPETGRPDALEWIVSPIGCSSMGVDHGNQSQVFDHRQEVAIGEQQRDSFIDTE